MKTSYSFRSAYTLIELLISITLSLFLLLGVTEMFRHVGSTMSDTQKSLNMSSNLNAVAMTLRSDLGKIDPKLAHQPYKMTQPGYGGDTPGYLEITDGMNAPEEIVSMAANFPIIVPLPVSIPTVNRQHVAGEHFPTWWIAVNPDESSSDPAQSPQLVDLTIGDVDDILAFTAQADPAYPFRGFINGQMNESLHAEIIWFVRGTTLYRRVLLLDEHNRRPPCPRYNFQYADNDVSVCLDLNSGLTNGAMRNNTLQDISRRERRFAHPHHQSTFFPYLIAGDTVNYAWYFLRMPTLEETVHSEWSKPGGGVGGLLPALGPMNATGYGSRISTTSLRTGNYYDFWNNPHGWKGSAVNWEQDPVSGSIIKTNFPHSGYVSELPAIRTERRHPRAGDDVILKNVISFDVKVWNPYWVPCVPTRPAPNPNDSNAAWMWAPPQYIDLGQDRFILKNGNVEQECFVNYRQNLNDSNPNISGIPIADRGYGFTLKGRYNKTDNQTRRTTPSNTDDEWHKKERLSVWMNATTTIDNRLLSEGNGSQCSTLRCVFDSWTTEYEASIETSDSPLSLENVKSSNYTPTDPTTWRCPPPYSEDLQSIQITIRCFEPQSGNIKQVRVVQQFPDNL